VSQWNNGMIGATLKGCHTGKIDTFAGFIHACANSVVLPYF